MNNKVDGDFNDFQKYLRGFVKERDWEQYHTPKNLAMALAGEVGELVEIFQWLTPEESVQIGSTTESRTKVGDELADVMIYVLRLADVLEIDLLAALWAKMQKNAAKYPVDLARGSAKKYTQLHDD